jgi:hypothetical protein
MRQHHRLILSLLILFTIGIGCASHKPYLSKTQQAVEDNVTERFVLKYVRPLSDPVAALAHRGVNLPPGLLASNRVTLVEVISKKGERRTLFEDESRRPPEGGMITGVDNARNIGVFFPVTLDQPEIEVRMNYDCDIGDFVAVHVVVPNPLLVPKQK